MGIPGILKEIGKGERIALSKLAVEHLERTRRPLRIAIDAAIWQFQNQAGQGGKNPALRTLFFRLLKLLALPIHPVFVYDGRNKPLTKRNKSVSAYGSCVSNEMSKKLVQTFHFPHHTAPGEAEAECALLQKRGIVDAVMSQDVDAIMFGSTMTLRDWSKESSRGNKTATHVSVLRQAEIEKLTKLDPDGMILVALLSGGDYNTDGLAGFGATLACEIAKAGFGTDLMELVRDEDHAGLQEWRERLQYELETNESGYFSRKHKTIKVPDSFPDRTILSYYTNPAVSIEDDIPKLERKWSNTWDQDIDIPALRYYVADMFDWRYRSGAKRLIRCLAPSLLAHRLRRGQAKTTVASVEGIKERRSHWINDGMWELRVEVVPTDIVGLNLADEEENPAYVEKTADAEDGDRLGEVIESASVGEEDSERASMPPSPSRKRKSPPWDPSEPEKMWIPETIVQLGVPALVEEWHQRQRDIMADPKKFATRKCAKAKETGMKSGVLHTFFAASKPGVSQSDQVAKPEQAQQTQPPRRHKNSISRSGPRTQTMRTTKAPAGENKTPGLERYFSHLNAVLTADLNKGKGRNGAGASARPCQKQSRPPTEGRVENDVEESRTVPSAEKAATESFVISSAPPRPSMRPQIPTSSGDLITAPRSPTFSAPSPSQTISTVTQRKKKKPQDINPPQQPISSNMVVPMKTPIEDFFRARKSRSHVPPHSKALKSSTSFAAEIDLPPEMSTGLSCQPSPYKMAIVSRDSLPGTWKQVAASNPMIRSSRTRLRVSCVDLTSD